MKTNKHTVKIRVDKDKRIYAIEDSINLLLSLAVIVLSVIAIGMSDTQVLVYRLIFGIMALITLINVNRFYREKPRVSALCLLLAAALAVLAFMI